MTILGNFVPDLTEPGMPCKYPEPFIAPGVRGYAMADGPWVNIPMIAADPEGAGNVGRFIDSLSPKCRFCTVTSSRLEGMLIRRGWWPSDHVVEDGPFAGSVATCFYHPAAVTV